MKTYSFALIGDFEGKVEVKAKSFDEACKKVNENVALTIKLIEVPDDEYEVLEEAISDLEVIGV